MKWWQQLKKRDTDLERELQSDLELEEEEQRERGLSPDEARYAARRAFGNTTLIREQTHEPGVGDRSNGCGKTFATRDDSCAGLLDFPLPQFLRLLSALVRPLWCFPWPMP
jgi:hypothetical protein